MVEAVKQEKSLLSQNWVAEEAEEAVGKEVAGVEGILQAGPVSSLADEDSDEPGWPVVSEPHY